ncbi:MAG TPA: serine hydrolase [Spirochaetaceae bacterium]|jgi:CubicO group peptidase (beta-lactamase class C family)|nr:serine hydrolase [Spirochaetaceae bacterium]
MNQIDFKEFERAVGQQEVNGVIILKNGEKIGHYQPTEEQRQNQYSVTKSITSTAVGIAIKEKLFSLDDFLLDYFQKDAPPNPSDHLKEMRLRHLITMSMGFETPMLMGVMRPVMDEDDWVRFVLRANVSHKPGTVFQYNNAGPYLMGVLIERLTGMDVIDYLMPRLFDPLEIERPDVERCPKGHYFGAGGMVLNVSELARIGQLYLQKGNWNGLQILPEEWVAQATSPSGLELDVSAWNVDMTYWKGYSFWFWCMAGGVYAANGKYGQYCIVMPDDSVVISVNSKPRPAGRELEAQREAVILNAVMQHLVPQVVGGLRQKSFSSSM